MKITFHSRADASSATSMRTKRCFRGCRIEASSRVLSLSSRWMRQGLPDHRDDGLRLSFRYGVPSLFGHVDNLFDAESVAVAEVVVGGFSAVFEIVESADMSVGKVGDVNIVPHASAVGCGIIVAENADVISRTVCNLQMMGIRWDSGLCASPISPLLCAPAALK